MSLLSKLCRFVDVEAMVRGLDERQPDELHDTVAGAITCASETPLLASTLNPAKCDAWEDAWDSHLFEEAINIPVYEMCYVPNSTLQMQWGDEHQPSRLQSFYMQDANVEIPLYLQDKYGWGKEALPRHIPTEIWESEILTYHLLFRAIGLHSAITLNTWIDCPVKLFDKPRYLIPGYRLVHAISLDLIRELTRENFRLSPHSLPFSLALLSSHLRVCPNVVYVCTADFAWKVPKIDYFMVLSQNVNDPCDFVLLTRGTEFSYESVYTSHMSLCLCAPTHLCTSTHLSTHLCVHQSTTYVYVSPQLANELPVLVSTASGGIFWRSLFWLYATDSLPRELSSGRAGPEIQGEQVHVCEHTRARLRAVSGGRGNK